MTAFWKHSARCSEPRRESRRARPGLLSLALLPVLAWSALCLGCGGLQKVERRNGDHVEVARSVPPRAYAWYARARYLHRLGEIDLAREAYLAVLDADPRSGAAYAGLGSTYCSSDRDLAERTFSRGLRRADERVPIHLEHGRCQLGWGEAKLAVASARQAFERDPSSPEASVLLVDALTAAGQTAEAARVARGHRLYARALPPPPPGAPSEVAIDRALVQGDFALAEALSLEVMPQSVLAARALALGRRGYAEELAALVTAASPDDATAWTVLALTRGGPVELEHDHAGPSPLATCLWAERLRSDVGLPSAAAYLKAASAAGTAAVPRSWQEAGDALLEACSQRLIQAGLPRSVSPEVAASIGPTRL